MPPDPRLLTDYRRFAEHGLPRPLEAYVRETYGIDLTSEYAGIPIRNPFGKASGQLSLNAKQVETDAEAQLGFVVLKTVIAVDAAGGQSMSAWAIPATHMAVEKISGKRVAEEGWTVTWKGRGWSGTLEDYCALVSDAVGIGMHAGMLVAPSCKYHLPANADEAWRDEEYAHTTALLLDAWRASGAPGPMPIEKDFSPTLAGSDRASAKATILRWLGGVVPRIRAAAPADALRVGVKVFNAMFEDDFQLDLLRAVHAAGESRPDYFIYGNRLFDPNREYEGTRGVAYGGPDLSHRNLESLRRFREPRARESIPPLPLSATGNIDTGARAAEYLLMGASSFQMHTLFQLPDSEFAMRAGSKTERALHRLLFDPERGFIRRFLELRNERGWKTEWSVADCASVGRSISE